MYFSYMIRRHGHFIDTINYKKVKERQIYLPDRFIKLTGLALIVLQL